MVASVLLFHFRLLSKPQLSEFDYDSRSNVRPHILFAILTNIFSLVIIIIGVSFDNFADGPSSYFVFAAILVATFFLFILVSRNYK